MLAYLALASSPLAAALLLPAGIALYIPFSVLVGLGQLYLPSRPGVAGGVTLGLASSVGGLAGPVLGWIASEHGLTASLVVVALVPIAAALCAATLRSARPGRGLGVAVAAEGGWV
jgi:FSR family fosmidomycin resistance protein-like MFS transporter